MKALVVVESVFGNTREVADAVARGLARAGEVEIVTADDAPPHLTGVDLVVAGGPTHAFGMTSPASRRSAAEQSGAAETGPGLREWLTGLAPGGGLACATFDTRTDRPRMPGSAAAKAARALRRKGYRTIDRPRTFRVGGTRGPLAEGEVARAEKWGADLAARCADLPRRAGR
jgi:hypothetical protein